MIAVLDWGIGGFGTYQRLRALHPKAALLYVSDAGSIPYGKLSAAALGDRLRRWAELLGWQNVRHLVVACHAASSVLPRLGVERSGDLLGPLAVTGIVDQAIAQARRGRFRTLGIVGGRRTIRSGLYRRALRSDARVIQRVAQPLSARVEAGDLDSPGVRAEVRRIVQPLRRADAVLLACTHYPALMPLFRAELPGVTLLDPAQSLAAWVSRSWPMPSGRSRWLTTGDPGATRSAARRAFGVKTGGFEKMRL